FRAGIDRLTAVGAVENGFHATVRGLAPAMGFRDNAGVCVVLISDEEATENILAHLPETQADAIAALAGRNAVFLGVVDPAFSPQVGLDYGPNPGSLAHASDGEIWEIQGFMEDASGLLAAILDRCIASVQADTTPDLVVAKSDGLDQAQPGQTLTYTLSVTNTALGLAE